MRLKITSWRQFLSKESKNCLFLIFSSFIKLVENVHFLQVFIPTPLVGEELCIQTGFFLFRQFWPIDIFIVEKCEWFH